MPGFGLYLIISLLAVCCDIGENIHQVSMRTINMYLFNFMSKSVFCFGMVKLISRVLLVYISFMFWYGKKRVVELFYVYRLSGWVVVCGKKKWVIESLHV